jgi:hypothetical protein
LKPKYEAAIELYDDMTRQLPRKRPNCEEVLKIKNSWSLSETEFAIDNELEANREAIISGLNDENRIIFSIFDSKLKISDCIVTQN